MIVWYYGLSVLGSLLCSAVYFWKWRKRFDIYFSLLYVLFPIVCVGYLLFSIAPDLGAAIVANKITYIGGCYLELILMLSIFSLCHIRVRKWISFMLVVVSTILYGGALSVGYSDIFYKKVSYRLEDGIVILTKEYGPLHQIFYAVLIVYFLISIIALIYGAIRHPDASIKNIYLLVLSEAVSIVAFFFGRMITNKVEFIPMAYVFDSVTYLIIVDRICLYDVEDSAIDRMVARGEEGFVSFDYHLNFLGCNAVACGYLPALKGVRVDVSLPVDNQVKSFLEDALRAFEAEEISR
ncbi:MAG: hypothetical protein IJ833_10275, partial [Lachnospiraceae bacterium]|nr:hypothetical protein [Lachnospiraceae bacterium]